MQFLSDAAVSHGPRSHPSSAGRAVSEVRAPSSHVLSGKRTTVAPDMCQEEDVPRIFRRNKQKKTYPDGRGKCVPWKAGKQK